MRAQKFSISLPEPLYRFLVFYQEFHHLKSRSDVISKALKKLQEAELESCYREAEQELDSAFDTTLMDGLDQNEAW